MLIALLTMMLATAHPSRAADAIRERLHAECTL